jgi:hypothetical protein
VFSIKNIQFSGLWNQKYHELWYEVKPYLDALHRAPELVRDFLEKILAPK